MKTIQVRWTRHVGHCWRSKDELISDVLLWTPTYGRAKAGRPAQTYIQQLCEDTGCKLEDLPEAMNDREKWRERVRDIRAGGTTWWWCWWYPYGRWKEKTNLTQKDPKNRTISTNYRPIMRLPMMCKILTAQLREEIYYSLECCWLFPEEQKGYHRGTREINDPLYIDQHTLKEAKMKQKNVAMTWTNNKKTYDTVLQTWIIERLKTYKIFNKMINMNAMENMRVELIAGDKSPKKHFPARLTLVHCYSL